MLGSVDRAPLGGRPPARGIQETTLIHVLTTCQSCQRPQTDDLLRYRKANGDVVRNERFLQCDICERHLCSECLAVYDIISGYDFLCRDCATAFPKSAAR